MNRRGDFHIMVEISFAMMMVLAIAGMIWSIAEPEGIKATYVAKEAALFVETLYAVPGDVVLTHSAQLPNTFLIAKAGVIRAEASDLPYDVVNVGGENFFYSVEHYMPSDHFEPLNHQEKIFQLAPRKFGRYVYLAGGPPADACPMLYEPVEADTFRVALGIDPEPVTTPIDETVWASNVLNRLRNQLASRGISASGAIPGDPDLIVQVGLHQEIDSVAKLSVTGSTLNARLMCLLTKKLLAIPHPAVQEQTSIQNSVQTIRIQLDSVHTARTSSITADQYAIAIAQAIKEAIE